MGQPLEAQIRKLQAFYWSDADPQGRGFVPLADALRRAGNELEALRLLREGLGRLPHYASGHVVKAWVHQGLGETEEAGESYRAALEADGGNVVALRGLGEIQLGRGEAKPALRAFREVLRLDPTQLDLEARVAEMELGLGAEEASAPAASAVQEASPPADLPSAPAPWDDPEEVARELDLQDAVLQRDRSREEDAAGLPVAPPVLPEEPGAELTEDDRAALKLGGGGATGELWIAEDGVIQPVGEEALVTRTLGEIYLRQGLFDQAEHVFLELLDRDPDSVPLRELLEQARARGAVESAPEDIPAGAGEAVAPDQAVLAADRGIPLQVVPIQDLAPDLIVPVESLAPDVVLPVEVLAPDLVVPIGDLAPDVIVPIESLAPDAEPVEAQAPVPGARGSRGGEDGESDPVLDAFQAWLDHLP